MNTSLIHWGSGPTPLMLLHGFAGGARSFDHLRALLSEGFSVTSVQLPGHGVNGIPAQDWEELLTRLAHVLSTSKNWCVAGYSQGARIALGLALRAPERISALVMESGSPGLRNIQARAQRRIDDDTLALSVASQGVSRFLEHWDAGPLFTHLTPEQRTFRERARSEHTVAGLSHALRTLGLGAQPSYWDALSTVGCPVLLLTGALDTRFTSTAQQMQPLFRHATHVTFPDVGHLPHLEAPRLYANHITQFLSNARSQGAAHDTQVEEGPRV